MLAFLEFDRMLEEFRLSLGAVLLLSASSTVQAQSADRVFLSDNILTSNPDMPRAGIVRVNWLEPSRGVP